VTEPALVLAPIACAVVLAVSGVAKLGDAAATRSAFKAMRVPTALSSPAAVRALPVAEIGLGALLLVTWGWALAVVATVVTVLFVAYAGLVARVLRDGATVDCHCFGSLGSSEVTRWTLARNAVLVVLAALAVGYGAGGGGLLADAPDLGRAGWAWVAMAALVAAAAVLVVAPGQQRAAELMDVPDDQVLDYERAPIPFAMLMSEDGRSTTLVDLARRGAQLLVFLAPGCDSCAHTVARMAGWQRRLGPVQIAAVFTHELEVLPDDYRWKGVTRWKDVENGATNTFARLGRPSAVLLGADGLVAGGPVAGPVAIERFVEDVLAELAEADVDVDEVREQVR
jgi:hypothetical protein